MYLLLLLLSVLGKSVFTLKIIKQFFFFFLLSLDHFKPWERERERERERWGWRFGANPEEGGQWCFRENGARSRIYLSFSLCLGHRLSNLEQIQEEGWRWFRENGARSWPQSLSRPPSRPKWSSILASIPVSTSISAKMELDLGLHPVRWWLRNPSSSLFFDQQCW